MSIKDMVNNLFKIFYNDKTKKYSNKKIFIIM